MKELLIGLGCCLGMAGSLFGYLKYVKKKYYNGKDPSSLSNTFYHTGWLFRALLISFVLWIVYPVLLANGVHSSAGWGYYAPEAILAWGKVAFAVCMGGILGVALNAYGNTPQESKAHVFSASVIAAVGGIAGCCLRPNWYIGAAILLGWLVYYVIKNHINNKKGNPNAWGLYIELVAFYSVPTCLAIFMLINYFF